MSKRGPKPGRRTPLPEYQYKRLVSAYDLPTETGVDSPLPTLHHLPGAYQGALDAAPDPLFDNPVLDGFRLWRLYLR